MLTLSRKSGQGVWIGDAHVIVGQFGGGQVRLCIQAPPDIIIKRDEIIDLQMTDGIVGMSLLESSLLKLTVIRREAEATVAVANTMIATEKKAELLSYWRGERLAAKRILDRLDDQYLTDKKRMEDEWDG